MMQYGDRCEFTCKAGYRLHERSAQEFFCNKDGFWSASFHLSAFKGREPSRSFTPRCIRKEIFLLMQ